FFFSSRRRHTRFSRDWSSDVCSSDLPFLRRQARRAPRLVFAVALVAVLGAVYFVAQPRPGDAPITVRMPFKVPGNEPKSIPLSQIGRASCRGRVRSAVGGGTSERARA